MSTSNIWSQIRQADQLSREGRSREAENLYRDVLGMLESDPAHKDLVQDLIAKIKQLNSNGHNGTALNGQAAVSQQLAEQVGLTSYSSAQGQTLEGDQYQQAQALIRLYQNAESDVHALVYSFRMLDIQPAIQFDGKNSASLFLEHVAKVRARMINNARNQLQAIVELQKQEYISPELYNQICLGYQTALDILWGKQLVFPKDLSQDEQNYFKDELTIDDKVTQCEEEVLVQYKRFQARYLAQQTQLPEPEPQAEQLSSQPEDISEPEPASSDPIPQDEQISMIDSLTQTNNQAAQDLVAQAELYLSQRSSGNYKEAGRLLSQALSLDGISESLRNELKQRFEAVSAEYDSIKELEGQLRTARQVANIEDELIVILTMINKDYQTDESGRDLNEIFNARLVTLIKTLTYSAEEALSSAGHQRELARNKLNLGPLQAARSLLKDTLKQLNGESIIEKHKQESAQANLESHNAVLGLAASVQERLRTSKALSEYDVWIGEIEHEQMVLEDARPFFLKALECYDKREYRDAWNYALQLKELLEGQFSSQEAERIYTACWKAYENELVARLELIEQKTKSAFESRVFDEVASQVAESFTIDPQFKSARIDELLKTIRSYQDRANRINRDVDETLIVGRGLLNSGQLEQAAEKAAEALRHNPNHTGAQAFQQSVLVATLGKKLSTLETTIAHKRSTREQLVELRRELQQIRSQAHNITDQAQTQLVLNRIFELENQLQGLIDANDQAQKESIEFEAMLSEIDRSIGDGNFDRAHHKIKQAERLVATHVERSERLATFEQRLKTELLDRIKQALAPNSEDPERALLLLDVVDSIGILKADSEGLRLRAQQLKHRLAGVVAFEQNLFKDAITQFEQADLDNPTTLELLNKARQMLAQQLLVEEKWQALVDLLDTVGTLGSELLGMKRKGQLELALDAAKQHLREKKFSSSESMLDQAEKIEPSDNRIADLRQQLAKATLLYNQVSSLVKQANDERKAYEISGTFEHYRNAIQTLDQALAIEGLAPDDKQRAEVVDLRSRYQSEYDGLIEAERTELLKQAGSAFDKRDIALALSKYRAVLNLMPTGKDAEADKGIERCLDRLADQRSKLSDEIGNFLNLGRRGQKGIKLDDIHRYSQSAKELLAIESHIQHEGLVRALSHLEGAQHICQEAERALQAILMQWAELRSEPIMAAKVNSDRRNQITIGIQHAASLFDLKTYTHIDLDHNNPTRLLERIEKDLTDLEESNKLYQNILEGFKQEHLNDIQILNLFERLRVLEERFHQTTTQLINEGGLARQTFPNNQHEPYPYQARLRHALLQEIDTIKRDELQAPDLGVLRALIVKRTRFESLQKRLYAAGLQPAGANGQQEIADSHSITIEMIDAWSNDAEKGSAYVTTASELERAGREDEQRKLLRPAVAKLEQAHQEYNRAIQLLEPISRVQTGHGAVREIVRSASQQLLTAQQALQTLAREDLLQSCKDRIQKAQELYQQAQAALDQGSFSDVRSYVDQAKNLDPTLSEQLDELSRAAGDGQQNERSFGPVIAIVVVLVLLAILVMMFGPSIWAWFSEVLLH